MADGVVSQPFLSAAWRDLDQSGTKRLHSARSGWLRRVAIEVGADVVKDALSSLQAFDSLCPCGCTSHAVSLGSSAPVRQGKTAPRWRMTHGKCEVVIAPLRVDGARASEVNVGKVPSGALYRGRRRPRSVGQVSRCRSARGASRRDSTANVRLRALDTHAGSVHPVAGVACSPISSGFGAPHESLADLGCAKTSRPSQGILVIPVGKYSPARSARIPSRIPVPGV